jgi:hypothetical protein
LNLSLDAFEGKLPPRTCVKVSWDLDWPVHAELR